MTETALTESKEDSIFSPTELGQISDTRLLSLISCSGFRERFSLDNSIVLNPPTNVLSTETGGWYSLEEGTILDNSNVLHSLKIVRDLDNVGIAIYPAEDIDTPLIRLNLRDRRYDGTTAANPPGYLSTPNITLRSYLIGATNWDYSHEIDKQIGDRDSLEMSIVSSDPKKTVLDSLIKKEAKLLQCTAKELADFIDDPFAAIPFDNPTSESLNKWYSMWWQVVQRGIRGKDIPFPGQISAKGFGGFLDHIVLEVNRVANSLGYTHISAVPTWLYVLRMFESRGFTFDHPEIAAEAHRFINTLNRVALPSIRRNSQTKVGDLHAKDPLTSWLAVVPFVMNLNTNFQPEVGITQEQKDIFDEVYANIQGALRLPGGDFLTYPLRPNRNVWVSKAVN